MWNSNFCKKVFLYFIVILRIARVARFRISLKQSEKLLYKKCYSTSSQTFVITRESEDEQKPVLISAHPPPKILWKLAFTETWIPQPQNMVHSLPRWHMKDICHTFLSGNLLGSRKDYWFFPKNSALNFWTIFFFYKDTFIYHINLEELKNKTWLRFLCVFKDMFVERSKNILKICPNLLHF